MISPRPLEPPLHGRWRILAPILLLLVGIGVYSNSFGGPFIFDDYDSVVDNPNVHRLWPLWEAMRARHDTPLAGRPAVSLTFALNYAAGGQNVWGYHAVNLGIHLASTLVLFGIVRRTLTSPLWQGRFGGSATGLGFAMALLWMVHPLQTEGVTYITQRTESLMALFYLLTLYCFIRGTISPRREAWFFAAVTACALGMASKEVMASAPLIVLLYDRTFISQSFREALRQRGGVYVGLAATWVLLGSLGFRDPRGASAGLDVIHITPFIYTMIQCEAIVHYLRLAVWPSPLVLDYDNWPVPETVTEVLPEAGIVLALIAGTVWALRRKPWLGFLGAWFLLVLAPTSSFIPVVTEVVAERRMYLPLVAVVALFVSGAECAVRATARRAPDAMPRLRQAQSALIVVLAVVFGYLTVQRNAEYGTEVFIWEDSVAKRPDNPRAHYNLAVALAATGRVEEAVAHYQEAMRINPRRTDAPNNLGLALAALGRYEEAIHQYAEIIRRNPSDERAWNNWGTALAAQGRYAEAVEKYSRALEAKPEFAEVHNNLGLAFVALGRTKEAIEHYAAAIRLQPDYADAHNNLGMAFAIQGQSEEALQQYAAAIRAQPHHARALNNHGVVLLERGEIEEAITFFREAAALQTDFADAHGNLASASAALGKHADAAQHYAELIRLRPADAEAHNNLGVELAQLGRGEEAILQFRRALELRPDYAEARHNLELALGHKASPR